MAVRWSWASPRLALIPSLAITAVAFFGAICWTIWISGHEHHPLPFRTEHTRKLPGTGCFTRTLQTNHHDYMWFWAAQV